MDITSEVQIPTYQAIVEDIEQRQSASGWGAHPNPEVALRMAILEAGQSAVVNIAGGREDVLIQARSLGRHEGARPRRTESWWYWTDPDAPTTTVAERRGHISNDIAEDLRWALREVAEAGVEYVAFADLSRPELMPARVVRVLLPGLEATSPFHMGPRARAACLSDMLPRVQRAQRGNRP